MKIEWLNETLTRAKLTRGIWWWKRVAIVRWMRKSLGDFPDTWVYEPSGDEVGESIAQRLDAARYFLALKRADNSNWKRLA